MEDFWNFTFVFIGIGLTLFGCLFAIFLYFNKRGNPKINVAKKSLRYCLCIIIPVYVLGLFFIVEWDPKQKHATKKDIEQIREDISKISDPSQEEVESEIDKRLSDEFQDAKNRAHELYQKGLSAYNKKAFNTAIGHFENAIKAVPLSSFYVYKGNSYFHIGQMENAITDYTEAIEIDQNSAIAFNNLGYALCKIGDYHQAIKDFTMAIELNLNYIEAYNEPRLQLCPNREIFRGDHRFF